MRAAWHYCFTTSRHGNAGIEQLPNKKFASVFNPNFDFHNSGL
jgi:hypothetical protein